MRHPLTVSDVMTPDVITVPADLPFKQIAELFARHRVSAFPVAEDGKGLVGIVSATDLPHKQEHPEESRGGRFRRSRRAARRKAAALTARDLMTRPMVTIEVGSTLSEAARLMAARDITRLVVVEGEWMAGIVTRSDLLGAFLDSDEVLLQRVKREAIEHALWDDPFGVEIKVEDGVVTLTGELDHRSLVPAQLSDSPIHAVHVVEQKQLSGPYFTGPGVDKAAKALIAEVDDYMAGHDETVGYTTGALTGQPPTTLAKLSKDAGMLVVGRRGTGMLARLLIGSTAEAVTHLAAVPVVVVPDRWQPQYTGAPVVVGVDEDEETDSALAFAAAAAEERGVPLRLVRVWDLPSMYTWDAASITDQYDSWLEQSDQRLQAIADQWRLKHPQLKIEAETRRGHPVAGLIAAAEESKAELLVLGGRMHNRLASALLGSTTRGVLHHAPCPVAIVHEPRDKN